jgi:hypothetical protein
MALVIGACGQAPATAPVAAQTAAVPPAGDQIARGKLLVTIGGCHDCHTPKKMGPKGPEPDMARMLMGHPEGEKVTEAFKPQGPWQIATTDQLTSWAGPWGISYPANLTPDTLTGLRSGVWTEALFIQALRTGKHMGTARDILPPMPWPMIGQMSDDDLKAIWAYLGSIPAIRNMVPEPVPPAPIPTQ